jgi:hypothetical protein
VDKFVSVEVFVAVVEAGSLTAAAERFDISPAAVRGVSFRGFRRLPPGARTRDNPPHC